MPLVEEQLKLFLQTAQGRESHAPGLAPTLRQYLFSMIARSRRPRPAQSGGTLKASNVALTWPKNAVRSASLIFIPL